MTNSFNSCLLNAADIALNTASKHKKLKNKKWFDKQCNLSRRNLNRLACRLGRNSQNRVLRSVYFKERNKHSQLIAHKKFAFHSRLNKAIEDGHVLDWKKFKQLKQNNDSSPLLDKFDLASFHEFFSSLYKKPESEFDPTLHPPNNPTITPPNLDILNKAITESDISKALKRLKNGKSCSTDQISNEMLQNLNNLGKQVLLKTFNNCLSSGLYPWHTSVITPIYKSGNRFSPDNYRAIAVGSCMGKLFSSILLDRLLLFKELYCPDPQEQLGFCKGAQTNDHILTLKTIIDKYTKIKKARLYVCFVDLRKAFDTVARDLLLHKIVGLGISGNFFNCLSDMYNNSLAQIKIANVLSPHIKIERGTEQGHPLSPDLFKLFIRDLSSLIKTQGDYPTLADITVSHLLWADDLVLLALNAKSLQDNIDILHKFCQKMGLEINIKKTKVLTFCPGRQNPLYENFLLGDEPIDHAEQYCYLGIVFHRSGSFTAANNELRAKALRALYGMKGNIIKDCLSHKARNILFDTLVKPVLLYGCQVLTPHSKTMKYITKITTQSNSDHFLKYIAQDHYEKFHLKYIKWCLSVHFKASNIGCWGDSGRYPLFYEACKLSIDYFMRVQQLYETSDDSLLAAAFSEQKNLGLSWYSNVTGITEKYCTSDGSSNIRISIPVAKSMREEFVRNWEISKSLSPKLEFYNKIKKKFELEKYLSIIQFSAARENFTRFRISCHNLYVERGRYETPLVPREERWCVYCNLTLKIKCIEDEAHVLTDCPLYNVIKNKYNFLPSSVIDLADMLADKNLDSLKLISTVRAIHEILSVNENYTQYYKSQDFHTNTGECILL